MALRSKRIVTFFGGFLISSVRTFPLSSTTLRTARGATSTTKNNSTKLYRWHEALTPIPRSEILPIGMGNVDNRANIAAFFGDQKILCHVGMELRRRGYASRGVGWLTKVTGQAVSNQLFSQHFRTILPVQSEGLEKGSTRDRGTMVEAAVDAVKDQDAISELAAWLLDTSLELGDTNAKGHLLEQGGSVSSKQETATNDNDPVFKAVAVLNDQRAEAYGRSKVEAEQAAAAKLHLVDIQSQLDGESRTSIEEVPSRNANAKGRLLQIGGTIDCTKDPSSLDHSPVFVAKAKLGTKEVLMTGSTKARAEQKAATTILEYFST